MCMMHAPINRKAPKVHKPKKREVGQKIQFNKELLKPDPDFIDERQAQKAKSKGFFDRFFD